MDEIKLENGHSQTNSKEDKAQIKEKRQQLHDVRIKEI